jgi:hypothetical protein
MKKITYGKHGYAHSHPQGVQRWFVDLPSPALDAAFRCEIETALREIDSLRALVNSMKSASPHKAIDKVRLVTRTLAALSPFIDPLAEQPTPQPAMVGFDANVASDFGQTYERFNKMGL